MIKLAGLNEEQLQVVERAFYDELEKNAGWINTALKAAKGAGNFFKGLGTKGNFARYAKDAENIYKTKGKKGLTDFLQSNKTKQYVSDGKKGLTSVGGGTPETTGYIQRGIGDMVDPAKKIVKDMKGKSLGGKTTQLGKNLKEVTLEPWRTAKYESATPGATTMFKKRKQFKFKDKHGNDLDYDTFKNMSNKGESVFAQKRKMFTKGYRRPQKIRGWDKGGNPIIKAHSGNKWVKRSVTPAGFAASAPLFGGGPKEAAKEYGMWTFAQPVAEAKLTFDLAKSLF